MGATLTTASADATVAAVKHPSAGTRLYAGRTLHVGQRLTSPSGKYVAVLRPHGVFNLREGRHVVWSSTSGSGLSDFVTRGPGGAISITLPRVTSHARTSGATRPSYLAVGNDGDLALYSTAGIVLWEGGLRAHVTSPSAGVYQYNQLYGGTNPVTLCYTCAAANITGSAPPSNTLDSTTNVDNLTGDFSTTQSLFSAPAIGGGLSLSLSYDAQLAQAQLSGAQTPGPFGVGWSSDFSASVTPQSVGSVTSSITVNQGSGAQLTFTQSADGGTSSSCQEPGTAASGEYPTTDKYTTSDSSHQWCASSTVQAQIGDLNGTGIVFAAHGGTSVQDFSWNGQLAETTTLAASSGSTNVGVFTLYNVAGGSTATTANGIVLPHQCPSGDTCDILYSSDARDAVEVLDSSGQVTQIIDPSGATYSLTYDANTNLTSVATPNPNGTSGPSVTNYVYSTSLASPYSSDLVQIYDPDAGVTAPVTLSPGAAHSEAITYYPSTSNTPGMVSSLEDGTGAQTTYAYTSPCATGQCVPTGFAQQTTITYPNQVPCPGCAAQSPVEKDQYSGGLETSSQLGSLSNPNESETWLYAWNVGNGSANSSEVITYPHTLNTANNGSFVAPTATIIWDPAGNIISTTNALGDVATSVYNDVGGNNLPELLWSFPGPVASGTSTPPPGASIYTYNRFGQVKTQTDPVGNVTAYGYYGSYSQPCYVAPPSVSVANSWTSTSSPTHCTSSSAAANAGALGAPTGATTFSYDAQGDVVSTTLDTSDVGAHADSQTTTSHYDVMGNQLWSIPATGQSGPQSASNPFATSYSYVSGTSLPATRSQPDGITTDFAYDAAGNQISAGSPGVSGGIYTTTVYDADNRACYVVVGPAPSSPSCASAPQAGSTSTTYVPGSTVVATSEDANAHTTSYYYGDLAYPNSPTQVVDPMATMTQYRAYDDYGNACVSGSVAPTLGASQCSTLAGDTSTVFNALGSPTVVTDPSGNQTTNAYQNASYPTLVTSSTSPLGAVTKYLYDADGRLLTSTNPDGSAVTSNYNANGEVCSQEPTPYVYPCGQGPAAAGVSQYAYNDAGQMVSMSDNVGSPGASRWSQDTTYSYLDGQLTSTTDANATTLSYAYDDAGQVACIAYPVSSGATCSSSASSSNTTVRRSYDALGRLSSVSDWLGNTTTYAYGDPWTPASPTAITYPTSTGLVAHYGYDHNGAVTSLSASSSVTSGTPISDSWTLNADSQVSVSSINGATSGTQSYNANGQLTQGANLATSTSNDTFAVAPNASILSDTSPSGSTSAFTYAPTTTGAHYQLCNVATAPSTCGSTAGTGTNFTYTTNGERSAATPYSAGVNGASTNYAWNSYGQLCNVAPAATACGAQPSVGTSYQYNGLGLRTSTSTSSSSSTTTTTSAWDQVSAGSIPLNVNDTTTSSAGSSTTSYLYGDLLFGGTAPVEQITTSSNGTSVSFLVSNQTGVQGVYSGNSGSLGAVQEMAIYSLYGTQSMSSGSRVTPFGFQGSYSDATGLIYLINRYYDPSTDQFLSIDPAVASTGQAYAFVNDNPLNSTDPLGMNILTDIGNWFMGPYHFDPPNHVVATFKTTPYNAESPTISVLTVGGYRYIQKHVAQSGLTQAEFQSAIGDTLGRPQNVKVQPNGSLLYSGPAALVDSHSGVILKKIAFFVAIDPQSGKVITAYSSTSKTRVNRAWTGGRWSPRG